MKRKYYEAYDDRYRQVHAHGLQWFCENPSEIVAQTVAEFNITKRHRLLEIGCGEGRDAFPLLSAGFDLLATDVSPAAIACCRKKWPEFEEKFQVLDCVAGSWPEKFDFIYAVAVVHMLVPDGDRSAFYRFIRDHLTADGLALICTMGDGQTERQSDIRTAFDLQERVHEQTGKALRIASTSCRMVSFDSFGQELTGNGLAVVKQGMTAIKPDFTHMMYAAVRRRP